MAIKKNYTVEFKDSAVKLAIESDKPIRATARELDINVNTLHTWIRKYDGLGQPVSSEKKRE